MFGISKIIDILSIIVEAKKNPPLSHFTTKWPSKMVIVYVIRDLKGHCTIFRD